MAPNETVVELEFAFDEGDFFLVEASKEAECDMELELVVPRSDGSVLEYFSVRGADPDDVLKLLQSSRDIVEVRLVERRAEGGLYELISDSSLAQALADEGTPVTRISATAGQGQLRAEVPGHVDAGTVIDGFLAENPGAELTARRETDRRAPVLTSHQFAMSLMTELTERQLRALRVAHAEGYFEWPRDARAADIAEQLGVATSTFGQHLRAAERKVFDVLFES